MKDVTIRIENETVPHPISALESPIQWTEQPDVMALAGIWEGKEITLEELRNEAWEPTGSDDFGGCRKEFLKTSAHQLNQVFSEGEPEYFKSDAINEQ